MRRTLSDTVRVVEYSQNIYFDNSYLHDQLKKAKPSVLVDLGANIGLSTLSLIEEFTTINKVIAIEAEIENFKLLKKNFKFWSQVYKECNFLPIFGVATNSSELSIVEDDSLNSLTGINSASGTFRFKTVKANNNNKDKMVKTIAVDSLFKEIKDEKVLLKIDIEGGEEFLFNNNVEWVKNCYFITLEIHDKFHPELINSSKNIVKILNNGDFALAASTDVLYFYNRKKLFR